ncbi:hypothetical protein A3K24_01325 [candidate division Kazan bacterium RIFCSPHIGHO2_01_FULL_44_14]|uniref:Uncharacterized protein n=1 Tax=candidate division Kazan bacterium RIFCSPLOWO2_01_FULL_45_19 TaxID=1798538 RepID=A0A1F4NPV8_UNCK3|nr:MAG: hypothetical protein A3K51_01325 [candidate division Kazan bacterium RIFCSPLOWO2_01_FULL_45_19]OGB77729.1 MAG: hypothetical protein A3K24_01325 [candidate division Kazan bacterium RIFCSPHIGHO2_01_FULL_44_14]
MVANDHNRTISLSVKTRTWFSLGNFLLLSLFVWNSWRMYQAYTSAKLALANPILSADPEKFAEQIASSIPPLWAWLVTGVSLIITLGLLSAWWVPRLTKWRWLALTNGLWLGGWTLYILLWLVVAVIVVSNLLRFT